MALRWIEGFEGVSLPDAGHARMYEATGGVDFLAEDGASAILNEAVSQDDGFLRTKPLVAAPENSWIFGVAFRPKDVASIEGTDAAHFALHNDDGEQCRIEFADANPSDTRPGGKYYKIRLMRGVTELCSTDQRFWIGTVAPWVYFEFKITVSDTVGSIVGRYRYIQKQSLNPSGASTTFTWDAANTSLDTQEQVTTGANRVEFSWDTGNAGEDVVFDDIYVLDSTGVKNNDYLGKVIIVSQKPAGDGTTIDWALTGGAASTEDALNESHDVVSTLEDDKRITSDVTGQVHLHTVAALTEVGANTPIIGVRHDIVAKMETTGDLDIQHFFRKTTGTPAEVGVGTAINVASTTFEGDTVVVEDDPNTATDWVLADMDSYQYGVKNNG